MVSMRQSVHAFGAMLLVICLTSIAPISTCAERYDSAQHEINTSSEIEPNDNKDQANPIGSGDVIEGSLKLAPSTDLMDYFVIMDGVGFGRVLTATLYHLDYNYSDPQRINFEISIWMLDGGVLKQLIGVRLANRTKVVTSMQDWNPDVPERMWILINCTCVEGGRYQLMVDVSDPPEYSGGTVTGYLSNQSGPMQAYYKINDISFGTGVRLKLQCPSTGDFFLNVLSFWPPANRFIYQNGSQINISGCLQEACLVGLGGAYYIKIVAYIYGAPGGYGNYSLTMENYGNFTDNDNSPADATRIMNKSPCSGYVASGVDTVDWWKVDMIAGKSLGSVSFNLDKDRNSGLFNFSVLDNNLKYIDGGVAGQGYNTINLGALTASYSGSIYFVIRAGEGLNYYGYNGGWGWYLLSMILPNDPPKLNSSLPEIIMDEDTVYNSLVLSEYLWDSDGNHINYTLVPSNYNTRPVVDRETGRVTFSPKKDWSGQEIVKFQAQDDGTGEKSVFFNTTVIVRPVNDYPYVNSSIQDARILEGTAWRTPDLRGVFSDVDDDFGNLSFGCAVVGSDSRPNGVQPPIKYDSGGHLFVIGPRDMLFGNFTFQLNCTDNHPGTVPASTRFSLTVTHVNHAPAIADSVTDPFDVTMMEHQNDFRLALEDLFTDPDIPEDYANDSLTYTVAGMQKLNASVISPNTLFIDASQGQYKPGYPGWEKLVVTAKDKAGRTATLNISVTIMPVNDPPAISSFQPAGDNITLKEMQKRTFSVTVSDPDTDASAMRYQWYFNGVENTSARDSSFAFLPDYSMGGTDYKIKVEVSDGNNTVSKEWTITVTDVNRLPDGAITSPLNFTKFVKGAIITFTANGSDPDGDSLTFIWRDGAGTTIGQGPTFTYNKLTKGSQTIRLEINDTKGSSFSEVTITITEQGQKKSPGFEIWALFAAINLCMIIALIKRR
jgi:hypothetical protein